MCGGPRYDEMGKIEDEALKRLPNHLTWQSMA